MADIVLRGGRVWDGLRDDYVEADISIDGPWIDVAGEAGQADTGIDVSGWTVIPGLIDAHAHLCFNAGPDWRSVLESDSPARMALRMAGAARRMVEAGITTVRDLGAPGDLAIEIREAVRAGLVTGPDLLVAGAPITTTGGHCWFMGGEADGELGVRVAVRERARAGVDWIKVMATGGMMTPGSNHLEAQYTVEELQALVEEARRLRLPVAAHCHGTAGIERAVAAGVDTIEHCSFRAEDRKEPTDELIASIAQSGIAVSPTVSVGFLPWIDSERGRRRSAYLRRLLEAGVRVTMSTDCGIPNVPHEALAGGMALLARMTGLSPIAVLRRTTSESADILGLADRGVIGEGKRADLVVVDGDPLHDLSALQRVRLVVAGGVVVCDRRLEQDGPE